MVVSTIVTDWKAPGDAVIFLLNRNVVYHSEHLGIPTTNTVNVLPKTKLKS